MLKAPDATFLYQIGLFVALWFILKRFWIDPALHVLHERGKRSKGAIAAAEKVQAEVAKLRAEHATALDQTRAEVQREVQDMLRAADAQQRQMIEEATAAAQATLEDARARAAAEIATAKAELDAQVGAIARQVATAVLGRAV